MFFFPYLSPLKGRAHTPLWSFYKSLLLVRPAFHPVMVLCLFFRLSESPGWLPTSLVLSCSFFGVAKVHREGGCHVSGHLLSKTCVWLPFPLL